MESLAPVSITGVTGIPGQMACVKLVSGDQTSGSGAGGTIAERSGAVAPPRLSPKHIPPSVGIGKDGDELLPTSSGEWPGRIRQFTMAWAICGRALLASPASSRVETQVVLNLALKAGSALSRAAADISGGVARIARISAAVSPVSFWARFVK